MNKLLTIFTPTYNRKEKLKYLYDSLCRQTNKNFKWLVIDDGSTDETKDLIKSFITEKKIEIQYYFQENSGKMKSHNKAVEMCTTELFLCVDSDDYLVDNAVEIILNIMDKPRMTNEKIIGLLAYRNNKVSFIENDKDRFKKLRLLNLQQLYDNNYSGETTLVFKTKIIRKYPFIIYENERFIQEKTVYNILDQLGKYIFFPENITIMEYQPDGISNNVKKILINNPKGSFYYYNQNMKYEKRKLKNLRNAANAISYGLLSNYNIKYIMKEYKYMKILASPIGIYLYIKRKNQ